MNTTDIYVPQKTPRSVVHTIRGVDYHVSEWGDSGDRPLVLLHGWGDSGSCFQFLVDQLLLLGESVAGVPIRGITARL